MKTASLPILEAADCLPFDTVGGRFGAVRPRCEIPPGAVLCEYCPAKCCTYFALPIETPKTPRDFDDVRWYLAHGDVSVFVDEGTWYLMVFRRCRHLQPDNRCGIYSTRPQICRDYQIDSCEYEDDFTYEKIFETDEQILEYAQAVLGEKALCRWQKRHWKEP